MVRMADISLDTTLAELYDTDSSYDGHQRIGLVLCAASSELAPTSKLARNTKFLYQDSAFISTPEALPDQQYAELQRTVAIKYLSLVPQHDAFAAGNMSVLLFDPDGSDQSTARSKGEAETTISSLTAVQRPRMLFFAGPKQIKMAENGIDLLMAKMELDELEGLPLALRLDTHYYLNSKAALCESGLPRYTDRQHGLEKISQFSCIV
ncbi:MAG: hypothetical protein LQ338_006749 [Usnochroma carphineum]|nr:MAG: hypothetical protein LQ338_006749 [Usnochroma carphineum]